MSRKKDKWIDYDFGDGKPFRFYTQVSDETSAEFHRKLMNGPVATFVGPTIPSVDAPNKTGKTKKAGDI